MQVFAWGRSEWASAPLPTRYPARQTLEASRAVARLHRLDAARCLFVQQHPAGIDAGAFHTDVLAVAAGPFFMMHELAFRDAAGLVAALREALGEELVVVTATSAELPVERAVAAYPFNSQILERADGGLVVLAPEDARADPASHAFLERVRATSGPVRAVEYVDVRQSMQNGGGPACLRLRVALTSSEVPRLRGRVLLDLALYDELCSWVDRRYRDRLAVRDLADPALVREGLEALDELTRILDLGSLYDFQQ
jgi:succinylarginine dihydrolase